jgi:hypothetical protein
VKSGRMQRKMIEHKCILSNLSFYSIILAATNSS